ncbi:hypothetical protein DERP_014196, partial [Dermatophagoides pteronyssinus]
KLGVKFVDAKQSVFLANGVKLVSSGRANVLVDINGVKKMVVLRVFPKLQHNLIIGLDIIRLFGLEQRKDLCIYMDDCLCTVTDVSVPMDKSFDDWSVLMDQSSDLFVGIGKSGKIRHRIDLISDKFGIRHEMSDLVELSQKRILANRSAQTLQKFQYDKDVKLEVLEPGDLVLWHQLDRALGSSKKLNKRWRGPFKIRAKEGPNFLIVDNFGNTRWIHHNHLKKVDSLFGESSNDILRSRGRPRLFNRGGEE